MKPIRSRLLFILIGSFAFSGSADAGCMKVYRDRIEELDPPLLSAQSGEVDAITQRIASGEFGSGIFQGVVEIKLKHNRKMFKIIDQAKAGGGPEIDSLYDDVKKEFKAPKENMMALIVQGNESNEFCKNPEGRLTTPNDLRAWLKAQGKRSMKGIKAVEAINAKNASAVSDVQVKKIESTPTGSPTSGVKSESTQDAK